MVNEQINMYQVKISVTKKLKQVNYRNGKDSIL